MSSPGPPEEVPGRRRSAGPPTIRDVAARAGVSKSVVSRVMTDSPLVSPERRRAVLEAAAELGYRPNAAARHLVQRRTFIVGAVVDDAIAHKERLDIDAIWMQLGVVDQAAAERARAAGIGVVMDTCPKIEWPRMRHGGMQR